MNSMKIEKMQSNQILYEENSVGDNFIIVKEGTLEETFKNKNISKVYIEKVIYYEIYL